MPVAAANLDQNSGWPAISPYAFVNRCFGGYRKSSGRRGGMPGSEYLFGGRHQGAVAMRLARHAVVQNGKTHIVPPPDFGDHVGCASKTAFPVTLFVFR
ncbi:MAG: hypothetical protein HYV36_06085 [Lentisphaerae bacterium]|nr:hypothetical protein [Lentisphaerota bacterium]